MIQQSNNFVEQAAEAVVNYQISSQREKIIDGQTMVDLVTEQ